MRNKDWIGHVVFLHDAPSAWCSYERRAPDGNLRCMAMYWLLSSGTTKMERSVLVICHQRIQLPSVLHGKTLCPTVHPDENLEEFTAHGRHSGIIWPTCRGHLSLSFCGCFRGLIMHYGTRVHLPNIRGTVMLIPMQAGTLPVLIAV